MNAESLALEAQLEIDAICQAFERAWQSGQQPRIEQYVSDAPEAIRERLREELAVAQAQLSTRRGAGSTDQADLTIPSDATINWTSSDVGGSALPPGYELLDELGRGGMGVVYKARQVGLDRLVALKMIRSGELASREEVERFNSEAQSAARLQHPYIVPVYEIGEHFGRPCFSMAFVGGMSLKDRVGDGPLNPRLAAELLLKTSQAVAYAHERGVVHRDLKPANILLNEAGDPCITDFGLAKRIDQGNDLTGAGQILGTPSYMPPEQALGQASQIGPLADVYALGATLYHLLTGRPPFQAASPIETIKQVIDTEPVPPRRLNDAVDRDLDTICMKCLEKQPARRYSSAHEIVQELTRYLNREPIQARRIGPMMRAMRWCRRKPLAATLAGVSSAAVIGGLLLVMRLFATQTLAESHRYFSEIGSARQAMEGGFPEWSRAALSHLEAAARIRPKSVDAAELRTAALQAWCAWDVRQLKKLSMPERVGAAAFSPDGGRLALAENLQSIKLRVGLYKTDFESPPDELNTYVFQDNLRVVFGNLKSVLDDLTAKRSPALRNRQTFRAAAFSGDGKFLIAGTRAGKIYMWSCGAPQMLDPDHSWQAHEGEIEQLCFSPDGKVIYSTAMLGESVKLWSPLGALLRELPGSHRYVAASPDGAWIATGGDTIQLFQAATLQAEPKWKVSGTSVAFSSDSKRLACGAADEETLQLVDVPSGRILRRFRDPTLINVSIANFLAFADHDRLLLSSCSDGRARVWDVFSGSLLTSAVAAGREFPDAAIHPDGRRVTVSGTSGTSLYEIVPAEVGHLAAVGEHPVLTIEFAPDTGLLAVAREQRRVDGLIRRSHLELWDVDANRVAFDTQVRELPKVTRSLFERVPSHVAFHPQGAEAVWSSSRANLRLKRNKQLPQPAFTLELGPLGGEILEEAAFTPDGDNSLCSIRPDPAAANGKALRLAPGGAAAVVLNGANLDALKPEFACYAVARIEGDRSNSIFFDHYGLLDGRPWKAKEVFGSDVPSHAYHLFQVSDMPWTNDSPHPKIELHLRAASPAGLKAIWIDRLLILPIATPYAKGKQGHGPELAALGPYAYAPEGDRLWGIEDHKPRCWSLNNFKQPFRVPMLLSDLTHGDDILRSVLGNAKLGLVGARRGDIFLLSAQDGKLQRSEFRPDTAITQVVLHPDGRRAVAATEQGKLWQFSIPELATMELKNAHGQSITSLACSRDGSVLVSGSQDRTVRVWSWRNEQLVERFAFGKLAGSVKAVRISDDKRRLAVLLDSELGVRIWKLDDLNDRFDRLHAKVSELP